MKSIIDRRRAVVAAAVLALLGAAAARRWPQTLSEQADHADRAVAGRRLDRPPPCARWPSWPASTSARTSSSRTSPAPAARWARARWRSTAKPDGYTIAQFPLGMLRLPHMQKVTWDPIKDFTFIIGVSGYTFGFVVRADSPYKTFNDYIEAARKAPGKIDYGLHRHRHQPAPADGGSSPTTPRSS